MPKPGLGVGMLRGAVGAAAAALWLAFGGMFAPAAAADLTASDQQCLSCHGMAGLEAPLTSGGTLSVHIAGDAFAPSVHSALGCATCHADIDLSAGHPGNVSPIADKRSFSRGMVQICANCHTEQASLWSKSVHAALVNSGNPNAPICTDCHSPHTMLKGQAASMATVPCKSCHAVIFTAYAGSVHGLAREHGLNASPLCFNCHGAHDISVPSAGVGRKDVCLGCHTEAVASHRSWLPNVDLHFTAVSCPVCHTPNAQRVVDLVLYNSGTQKEVGETAGVPEFENLSGPVTAKQPGLAPAALMTLLRALNHEDADGRTIIRGRLEVRTGVEDHQLTLASGAISSCDTCHRQGATAFQSVEVSVAGPAGIPIHYGADKDVLNSVFSVDAVSGFYAIGGTRITFFDVLLFLALVGGIAWPIGHAIVRWLVGRYLDLTTIHEPH